jgi:uncharacterized membrane protein
VPAVKGLLLRYAPFLAAAVLLAVLVHILTVLTLLGALAGSTGVTVLPPERPGAESTPFADPAMVTALCAFDLAEGPFRIRTQLGESYASLVVLSPKGAVIHGLTDKAATRRLLDVALATEQQIRALEAQDPDDRPPQEIRLRVSVQRGLAVLRALAPRPSDAPAVAEALRRTQCAPMAEP